MLKMPSDGWLKSSLRLLLPVIMLGLLLQMLFGGSLRAPNAALTYTEFKAALRSGQIEIATVGNDQISGKLADGTLYHTVRVDDPDLLRDLEANQVNAAGQVAGNGGIEEREQTLNQLLAEMDGFESQRGVIVLAATNRPEVLDPALLRPGRFDRQITVDLPDVVGREEILRIHAQPVTLAPDVELPAVARITPGFSGADLENVVNQAALAAARQDKAAVEMADFDEAIERVIAGSERRTRAMNAWEKQTVAVHEAGHALVASLLPGTDPVHKVTIVPRGRWATPFSGPSRIATC